MLDIMTPLPHRMCRAGHVQLGRELFYSQGERRFK
jgi:hypothetical protein